MTSFDGEVDTDSLPHSVAVADNTFCGELEAVTAIDDSESILIFGP